MNSFDVFDTLIARRHPDPRRIFDLVGERAGIADFRTHRVAAEQRAAASGDYTLRTIYAELAGALGISPEEAERCKAIELEAEFQAVIPVLENISRVKDGDLLVSDMYLDRQTIRQLLDNAGITKNVDLVVSAQGKRLGTIWPELKSSYRIARHLGDNWHSDRVSPRKHWIRSAITDVCKPTKAESILMDMNLPDLALLCREIRLATWHEDPLLRELQIIQADLNFPLLLLASIRLLRVAEQMQADRILFCARDCNLWIHLFEALARHLGVNIPAEYFYTSRLSRVKCSPSYRDYATPRLTGRVLVVDIASSGWSIACLNEALGLGGNDNFLIHRMPKTDECIALRSPVDTGVTHSLVEPSDGFFRNWVFEACNYAEHGCVEDVRMVDGTPKPVFATDLRSRKVIRAIEEQQRVFMQAVALLDTGNARKFAALDDGAIREATLALYKALSSEEAPRIMFKQAHNAEDRHMMIAMGMPVPPPERAPPVWRRLGGMIKARGVQLLSHAR